MIHKIPVVHELNDRSMLILLMIYLYDEPKPTKVKFMKFVKSSCYLHGQNLFSGDEEESFESNKDLARELYVKWFVK